MKSFVRISRFSSKDKFIQTEKQFGCYNYHPLPVVIQSGKGIHVQDVDGK